MSDQNEIRLKIDWEADETKKADYVNHLVLASDGTMATLRFYQVLPPLEVATKTKTLGDIEAVVGRHIATFVVAVDDLPGIVAVMNSAASSARQRLPE